MRGTLHVTRFENFFKTLCRSIQLLILGTRTGEDNNCFSPPTTERSALFHPLSGTRLYSFQRQKKGKPKPWFYVREISYKKGHSSSPKQKRLRHVYGMWAKQQDQNDQIYIWPRHPATSLINEEDPARSAKPSLIDPFRACSRRGQ